MALDLDWEVVSMKAPPPGRRGSPVPTMTEQELARAAAAGLEVRGDTYAVKTELRQLGCTWDHIRRFWMARTPEMKAEADAIVNRGPVNELAMPVLSPQQVIAGVKAAATGILVAELRRRGVPLHIEAPSTLADALAGWPPTIDDLAGSFDYEEFAHAGREKDEGR